jgi:hypothetical protein
MATDLNRRDMLRLGAAGFGAAVVGAALANTAEAGAADQRQGLGPAPDAPFAAPPMDVVRVAYVGVGLQGSSHCENLLRIPGVRITALCDIVPEKVERMQQLVVEAGQPKPAAYTRGERDFERLCETEDVDLVYTATPWEWHVPVLVSAMKNGKHAATEVPAAITLDECWQMVEHAEKYKKHCVMMENCNYDRPEMLVLNLVRQGLLGDVLHAECGYLHDLRAIKFEDKDEGLWRRAHAMKRNGNLYPTHGLGPVANCLDINRGDRFAYLVSMSGPSRGLQRWAQEHYPEGSPKRAEQYVLGDVNTTLIKTANGKTIFVSHDTNLPRPYSRIHMVQGTRGLFQGYPNRVYIEGRSPAHQWEPIDKYWEEFEHPLWKELGLKSREAGHGGMDYLEDYRLIKCLREGTPLDMTVYDAAAISAVCELSERSVAQGSRPMEFPDFTRGRWKTTAPQGIVTA